MVKQKGLAALASCALLACAGLVRAEEQPQYLADAPTPNSAIGTALSKSGAQGVLDKAGIKVGGFVEASWNVNTNGPRSGVNDLHVFDVENNEFRLNQLDLNISKAVDMAKVGKGQFDWGFTVEALYGADGRFIHSYGIAGYNSFRSPINQFDLTQAYAEFGVPVGSGLDIKVGKFVTPLGTETINPTTNAFFSHSYSFGFAIPFTQTGILATYNLSDKLAVTAGITRGWEVFKNTSAASTSDSNSSIDFLGQVVYKPTDTLSVTLNVSLGPERAHDNHDYRLVIDPVVTWKPNKDSPLSIGVEPIFGWEDHASLAGKTAYWYGATGYVGYTINDYVTANARAEWFRDDGGSRTGTDASYYEVTLGATIKPLPRDPWGMNLLIRPEIRWDHSNRSVFDGAAKKDQGTIAVDVIFVL